VTDDADTEEADLSGEPDAVRVLLDRVRRAGYVAGRAAGLAEAQGCVREAHRRLRNRPIPDVLAAKDALTIASAALSEASEAIAASAAKKPRRR
jgi:hypothetical protein